MAVSTKTGYDLLLSSVYMYICLPPLCVLDRLETTAEEKLLKFCGNSVMVVVISSSLANAEAELLAYSCCCCCDLFSKLTKRLLLRWLLSNEVKFTNK